MNIKEAVHKAAEDNGINGVLAMVDHCGIPYPRLVRIWKGDNSAKISDVISVLSSLGLKLAVEKA
tara:strand:+ start:334 stop:528 length:195 start_codon:yes stop_codon:yes gene_type:complete